jgi:hypothetical protein
MQALLELDAALRLNDQVRSVLLPQLTKLLETSDGLDALTTVLAREPIWRDDFLRTAGGEKLPPAQAVALLRLVSAKKAEETLAPNSASQLDHWSSMGLSARRGRCGLVGWRWRSADGR